MTAGHGGAWLRSLTGLLAGGTVALALALGAAWLVADRTGSPGPGPTTLVWHGLGAVAAVAAQRYADRHGGPPGALAALAVAAVTGTLLAAQWLW